MAPFRPSSRLSGLLVGKALQLGRHRCSPERSARTPVLMRAPARVNRKSGWDQAFDACEVGVMLVVLELDVVVVLDVEPEALREAERARKP